MKTDKVKRQKTTGKGITGQKCNHFLMRNFWAFFLSMFDATDPHFTIWLSLSQHFLCPVLCILATKTKVAELEKK